MSTFAVEGLDETTAALAELQRSLRAVKSGELRAASVEASSALAGELRAAAGSCGVPVASRVAGSIRPTNRDGWPGVSIGGYVAVGRYGAIAAKLLWGSERGPAGEPNHFAVGSNAAGYWIAPTCKAFKSGPAMARFQAAVDRLIGEAHLD
jgi:hypothetical protein